MNFHTMIQTGPVRANELLGKLAETSDAAVKNRGKLLGELKTELEQHLQMEQDHLLPILRKNAATKELAAEAVKDNSELRSRLAELESLPKNDKAFPDRLAEVRKAFRQHARNDRKELLPAVQQALKADAGQEGTAQGSAPPASQPAHPPTSSQATPPTGIEPSLAAAARANQHEAERRQAEPAPPASQSVGDAARNGSSLAAAVQTKQVEAEQRQAEAARQQPGREPAAGAAAANQAASAPLGRESNLAAAVLAKQDEAELTRHRGEQDRQAAIAASQEQVRQRLDVAERDAAAERLKQAAARPAAEVAAATAEGVRRVVGTMAEGTTQVGAALREAGRSYLDAVRRVTPEFGAGTLGAGTAMPGRAAGGMTELGSAWFGFLGQQAAANARMTHDLAEQQRQLAAAAWRSLLDTNAQALGMTLRLAQQGLAQSAAVAPRPGDDAVRSMAGRQGTAQETTRGATQGPLRMSTAQFGNR